MSEKDEQQIILLLKDEHTQRQAFNEIVLRYSEPIYWHVRKMVIDHDDANDLVQNTFIKAWTNIQSFRGDSKLSTWLYRIAINECLSFLGSRRQKHNLSLEDADSFLLNKLESSEYIDGDELVLKLQRAILTLPEKQRLVFNMRYYDDLSYEEISELLGTSVGALKASYHHAAKKIETFFDNEH